MSPITFYFLQSSRAIRIAWLLEELGLEYNLDKTERAPNGKAPPEWTKKIGTYLGKSPAIRDGDLVVQESGAITEYLCDNYDPHHRLIPTDKAAHTKVREWIFASEATIMMHAAPILYARWTMPDGQGANAAILSTIEEGMSVNVQKDLSWVESELEQSTGKFLLGDTVTAADCNMHFPICFILARQLGTQGKKWERLEQYVKDCEATDTFKKAVQKTGHHL